MSNKLELSGRTGYVVIAAMLAIEVTGCEGPTGPAGPQGIHGARGEQGERGFRGADGVVASFVLIEYTVQESDYSPSGKANAQVIAPRLPEPEEQVQAFLIEDARITPATFIGLYLKWNELTLFPLDDWSEMLAEVGNISPIVYGVVPDIGMVVRDNDRTLVGSTLVVAVLP